MSDTVLVCSECRPNFVITLDMDDSADQKLFELIWANGFACPECGQRLEKNNPNKNYTTSQNIGMSATDAIKTYVTDRVDSRDEFDTSNVSVPSNLVAVESTDTEGFVKAHISQLLPIKACIDSLAREIVYHGKSYIPIKSLSDEHRRSGEPASMRMTLTEIRRLLIEREYDTGVTKRGFRPSAGFPRHRLENSPQMMEGRDVLKPEEVRKNAEDKSWKRFQVTVIGGLRSPDEETGDRNEFGALYQLGLATLRKLGENHDDDSDIEIGLTQAGRKLAGLENPLLNVKNISELSESDLRGLRFSVDERNWFHTHTKKRLKKEWDALIQVIGAMEKVSGEKIHVKRLEIILNESVPHVRELKEVGSPPPKRAYTSSLVNRWTGLGLLCRGGPGEYGLAVSVTHQPNVVETSSYAFLPTERSRNVSNTYAGRKRIRDLKK